VSEVYGSDEDSKEERVKSLNSDEAEEGAEEPKKKGVRFNIFE
jgi:hypothetical protein